ncbi:MAG: SUMF1/EgtB/PvdO family nonheme iron enzyme [Anaerolineales bacterium]|nr:SUMF1/EgtB/PvdO family nonheme iron enzyme [Anaerolineales bacterium]
MLGSTEVLIVLAIVLLIFGGPALLRELGKAVKETRKAVKDAELLETVEEIKDEVEEIQQEVRVSLDEVYIASADPLRVFVCSMQDELREEREAIERGLRPLEEVGLTRPIRFESLPPSPDTPEEAYRRAVQDCDAVVIVVAEDISAPVVREYRLAIENGKPIFGFVKDVEQRSEEAKRFLAEFQPSWSKYHTPEELARKAKAMLVSDLLINWRERRLGHRDLALLIPLGVSLQLGREILERARQAQEEARRFSSYEPEMVYIPAGHFWMGSEQGDQDAWNDEIPKHRLYLHGYWIGKYPVTNAQFAAFVEATGHRTTAKENGESYTWMGSEWKTVKGASWKHPSGPDSDLRGKADHPVVHISWDDAMAFCRWLSEATGRKYSLPSEAEWEKAARGADGRIYPWGNEPPDERRCNFGMNVKHTTEVGKYSLRGDSPYGCVDMAGNVWEWTRSLWGKGWESPDYKYPYDPGDGREDPGSRDRRVLRGGAFLNDPRLVRCAFRHRNGPDYPATTAVFGCVFPI